MVAKRVSRGVKLALWSFLYVLIFFISTPSVPMSEGTYQFWNNAAAFFDEVDVEGFIGVTLIGSSTVFSTIIYMIAIKLIEKRILNKS